MRYSLQFKVSLLAVCAANAAALDNSAVMAKLRGKYQGINTIKAAVTETMCSAATGTCKRFEGSADMKRPAKLRLDITKPDKQIVACDGATLTLYVAKDKQAYTFDMGKSDQALTLLNPLDGLLNGEVVKLDDGGDTYTIALAVAKFKDYFKSITLTVDKKTLLITGIAAEDASGNNAEYEFTNIKLNVPVKDSRFTLQLPKGTKVTKQ